MRFFKWLKGLLNYDFADVEQQEISKTIINRKTMARKTVISKVVEENAQDGVIEFPQTGHSMLTSLQMLPPTQMKTEKASRQRA